jgi:metal-dependent amidase/aminoacylase/carboxypeptidase family protein
VYNSYSDYRSIGEEGGGGKVILLERGAYDDMDACIM